MLDPATMGMASSAMPPLSLTDETKQDLRTEVDVGGFTGGDFNVSRSMFDGLGSKDRNTQLITGAVMLGGIFVAGITIIKLFKGRT